VVLAKLGVPPKLIRLLRALHTDVKVHFTVQEVQLIMDSLIGVKQGDILGPILFVLFICGIMVAFRKKYPNHNGCIYRSKADFVLRSRSALHGGSNLQPGQKGHSGVQAFQVGDSAYADDCMFAYPDRHEAEIYIPRLYPHFETFGMTIHSAPIEKAEDSKSELTFFAAPYRTYLEVDLKTEPPTFVHAGGERVDFSDLKISATHAVPITFEFKYLGSITDHSTSDTKDVDARCSKAGAAFGALSKCLFMSPDVSPTAKGLAYKTLVLTILLYGIESTALTQASWNKLRKFHNDCVRRMSRTTTYQQWKSHIRNTTLRSRLHLEEIEVYVYKRQLAWLGDVARMPAGRMPRRLLSGWVAAVRPVGGQRYSYAKGVLAALAFAGIKTDTKTVSENWPAMAANKDEWNAMVDNLGLFHAGQSAAERGAARAPSSPLRAAADPFAPNGHVSSCLCPACCLRQQQRQSGPQQQQQQTPTQPPHSRQLYPVVEAANSDEDSSSSSSSSGGFVRNSSSSVTSGNDSSGGDSSDNNSDAGAVSGGDSPQRVTWDAQRDARRTSYPTRGRAQRDRRERENENKSSE